MSETSRMLEEFNQLVNSASGELTEEEKGTAKVYEARLKKIEELRLLATTALNLSEKIF